MRRFILFSLLVTSFIAVSTKVFAIEYSYPTVRIFDFKIEDSSVVSLLAPFKSSVVLSARGNNTFKIPMHMKVVYNNQVRAVFTLSPTLDAYTYNYRGYTPFDIKKLRVEFSADPYKDSTANVDIKSLEREFYLSSITVGKDKYDPRSAFIVGAHSAESGCTQGDFKHTNTLECNGYFDFSFEQVTATPVASNITQVNYDIEAVIGQINTKETNYNSVVPNRVFHPGGVLIDTTSTPNKAYVYDSGNNRILGFESLGFCAEGDPSFQSQIIDSSESLSSASYILDGVYGICNAGEWALNRGDASGYVTVSVDPTRTIESFSIYDRACPDSVSSGTITLSDGSVFSFDALENTGRIPTTVNVGGKSGITQFTVVINRGAGTNIGLGEIVINYSNSLGSIPCTSNLDCGAGYCSINPYKYADIIIGQPSGYDHGSCNLDNTIYAMPSASTLCSNSGHFTITKAEGPTSTTMDVDLQGNLYVADFFNNRILRYNNPFTTGDSVADYVWGQDAFTTRSCNKGRGFDNPSADSLCMGHYNRTPFLTFSVGLDVDSKNNMWVTDAINQRVLRFSDSDKDGIPDKTADIVLGQSSFKDSSSSCAVGSTTDLCKPNSVVYKESTDELFVVDNEFEGAARVVVFGPGIASGMHITREIGRSVDPAFGLRWPRGIALYPQNPTSNPNGDLDLIVNDNGHHRTVVFDNAGKISRVLGQPDASSTESDLTAFAFGRGVINDGRLYQADGGIGVDSAGSIYLNDLWFNPGVSKFDTPLVTLGAFNYPVSKFLIPSVSGIHQWNSTTAYSGADWNGFSLSDSQLFVSDKKRLLVWNAPADTIGTNSPADFVIGQDGFDTNQTSFIFSAVNKHSVSSTMLWVADSGNIFGIPLPITSSALRLEDIPGSVAIRSALGELTGVDGATFILQGTDVEVDPYDDTVLWYVDTFNSRILRISNATTSPIVTMVIGQPDARNSDSMVGNCNRGGRSAHSLCNPSSVKFDNFGNMYVAEGVYEGRDDAPGNMRIIEFDKNTIDSAVSSGNMYPLPDAQRIYGSPDFNLRLCSQDSNTKYERPCNIMNLAFDKDNRLFISVDSWYNRQNNRLFAYKDPLRNIGPVNFDITKGDFVLPIPVGQGGDLTFDSTGNLWFQDHTWNRLLKVSLDLTESVSGDCNADGKLSILDLLEVTTDYLTNSAKTSAVVFCDYDGNGSINTPDIIKRFTSGLTSLLR
ncbi:hypothetical protein KC980_03650 [candidate division WWE3 bacterium]|uniref:DUF7402 domain-containing protein n=1 Tax=candidate division WWE3 bacterium TaxID=2053526 RepID=A0A955J248_UNCKA|nr:hypothetical protein [candidate division WWE3 bacterium]